MINDKRHEKGFTLLELAIVLIIVGLIATPFVQEYHLYAENVAKGETEERFYTIESAVQDYYERNGFLPCPAESFTSKVLDAGPPAVFVYSDSTSTMNIYDNDDFGIQNCSDFEQELSDDDQTVLMGAVPTKTLGLNAEQALDGWGNKLTFVVSKYMLNIAEYDTEMGTSLNTTIDTRIEFFARDTGSALNCNTYAVSGFEERSIIHDINFRNGDISSANEDRTSEILADADPTRVFRENLNPHISNAALCSDNSPSNSVMDDIDVSELSDFETDNLLSEGKHILLISHGPTGGGAFNGFGALVAPCDEDALDGMNCIRSNGEAVRNNLFYVNAFNLDAGGEGVDFYDDIVYSLRADTFKLFTEARPDDTTSDDVYSPYEIIGIATDDPMGGDDPLEDGFGQKLPGIDVGGDIVVESGPGDSNGRAMASTVCSEQGAAGGDCFSPSIIAGSGIGCDSVNSAMSGISNNNAECFRFTPFAAGTDCDTVNTDEVMVGVNSDGTIICEIPPFP